MYVDLLLYAKRVEAMIEFDDAQQLILLANISPTRSTAQKVH